jgi:hypothetical protein
MVIRNLTNNYYINEMCKLLKRKNKNSDFYKKVRLDIFNAIKYASSEGEIGFPHVLLDRFNSSDKYNDEYVNIIMDRYVNDLFEIITKFGNKPVLFGNQESIIKQTLIRRIKEKTLYSYIDTFGITRTKLKEIKFDYIYKNS